MKISTASFVFLFLVLSPLQGYACNALTLENAWIRLPPPGAPATAGYMTIRNASAEDYYVTAVSSPAFEDVQLHESVEKDGMAKMIHHDYYRIPANAVFEIKPGSYHLMLFRWKDNLREGDVIPFEVKLGNGKSLTVDAVVKRPQ